MTKDEIEQKINSILTQDFQIPLERIKPDASFKSDLRLDSLEVVDFIMLIQKDFKFKSSLEAYRDVHTVTMLVDFVASKVA